MSKPLSLPLSSIEVSRAVDGDVALIIDGVGLDRAAAISVRLLGESLHIEQGQRRFVEVSELSAWSRDQLRKAPVINVIEVYPDAASDDEVVFHENIKFEAM